MESAVQDKSLFLKSIINMKKVYLLTVVLLCLFYSCSKEEIGQYPVDGVAPGEIKTPEVRNIPGGAIISYIIPDDEDLLYVKVIYKLDNGTTMEQKASSYERSVKVEGLGRSREQTVQLIAYDRSNNSSNPVTVSIHPEDAAIYSILESIDTQADFGGIYLDWENPTEAEVVLMVFTENLDKRLVTAQNFYTRAQVGKGNVRGYPSQPTVFAVALRDRWGNLTDTVRVTYTPMPEVQLDRLKFRRWNPADNSIPYTDLVSQGWIIENMWDNNIGAKGFSFPLTTTLPANLTFDLGQTAKLSRFKLHHRADASQLYTGGNFKKFRVYGSATPGVSADFDTWTKIGEYQSIKPSGLPMGQISAEDLQYASTDGEDFNVDINAPPIRYLRFVVDETWGGNTAAQVMELKFFGEIK